MYGPNMILGNKDLCQTKNRYSLLHSYKGSQSEFWWVYPQLYYYNIIK